MELQQFLVDYFDFVKSKNKKALYLCFVTI